MKIFGIFFFYVLLIATPLCAQVDSFRVSGNPIKFRHPANWPLVSKEHELSDTGQTNLVFDLPPNIKTKKIFGNIAVIISEITDEELAKRRTNQKEDPKTTVNSWNIAIGNHTVGSGYSDKKVQGDIHEYSKWYYCPLSDSIEVLIFFYGHIRHSYESVVDAAVDDFADYFFLNNDESLEALSVVTWPDPKFNATRPIDSMIVLDQQLRYPIFDGWGYDTTRKTDERKTTLLKASYLDSGTCNYASITLTYLETKEAKASEKVNWKPSKLSPLDRALFSIILNNDSLRRAKNDSAFKALEQHYYFTNLSDFSEQNKCAIGGSEYSETTFIWVVQPNGQRIRFAVKFTFLAANREKAREIKSGYTWFINEFVLINDFEVFYKGG